MNYGDQESPGLLSLAACRCVSRGRGHKIAPGGILGTFWSPEHNVVRMFAGCFWVPDHEIIQRGLPRGCDSHQSVKASGQGEGFPSVID